MPSGNSFRSIPSSLAFTALLIVQPSIHAAVPTKHLPLPATATIQIGKKTLGNSVSDAEMCKAYTVTTGEIRRYFRTYRLIDEHEKHYRYQQAACFIEGTVTLRGKTFRWIANPGGTLGTTYPDGVQKELGTTDPAMLDTP
jgi:hypothetical protein